MQKLIDTLDHVPLATLSFLVIAVLTVIAYLNGTVTYEQAVAAVSAGGVGTGVLGYARAQSGKGLKKP